MRATALLLALAPAAISAAGAPRASITFILGADEEAGLPMYKVAEAYFRTDAVERTDQVVLGLRSLREVRNHLAAHPPSDGQPWGIVNLVIHANARGNLDAAIEPGGPSASPASLGAALREERFPPAPDAALDERSELRIQGCSAGKDPAFLSLLAEAFGGKDPHRPQVRATTFYTGFQDGPKGPERLLCEGWDLIHPPGSLPPRDQLEAWWRAQDHPAGLKLGEALSNHGAPAAGGLFSYESEARFTWTLVYATGDPPASAPRPAALRAWLLPQESFQRSLQRNRVDFEQFAWTAELGSMDWKDEVHATVRVIGEGRALHILRRLPAAPGNEHPERDWGDARLYTSVR